MRPDSTPRLLPLLFLVALGCGTPSADKLPALHPVSGTLTRFDGKPPGGGALRFHATGGAGANTIVTAEVSADGAFVVYTAGGSGGTITRTLGAPAGKYQATFTPLTDEQSGRMAIDIPEPVTIEPKETVLKLKLPKK